MTHAERARQFAETCPYGMGDHETDALAAQFTVVEAEALEAAAEEASQFYFFGERMREVRSWLLNRADTVKRRVKP